MRKHKETDEEVFENETSENLSNRNIFEVGKDGEEKIKQKRQIPQNDLDLNLMTINTEWGSTNIPLELQEKLSENLYEFVKDSDGNLIKNENNMPAILVIDGKPVINKKALWQLLGFYTRDIRLGNLSKKELDYCQYYLDLANDDLRCDFTKAFLISLSRAVTILELSQSKKGFLRKVMQTVFEHKTNVSNDSKKRNLFGLNKSGGE